MNTLGTLIHDATTAALSDPSIATSLSPQSVLIGNVVNTTIAGATGASTPTDVAAALTGEVMSQLATTLATTSVRELAGAVPVIQQVVAIAGMVVEFFTSVEQENDANDAMSTAVRDAVEKFFVPVATVAEGKVPADIFAAYDAADAARLGGTFTPQTATVGSYVTMPGYEGAPGGEDARYRQGRPLIGHALIRACEGDGYYLSPGHSGQKWLGYHDWCKSVRKLGDGFAALDKDPSDLVWMQKIGIPAKRRTVYLKLRLAIEAQRKRLPKGSADGGVSLWPLYQDMLREDFAEGHLSVQGIALLADGGYPTQMRPGYGYPSTAKWIADLVASWELRIQPWYAAGQDAQVRAMEESLRIAEKMGPESRLVGLAIAISSSPPPRRPRLRFNW